MARNSKKAEKILEEIDDSTGKVEDVEEVKEEKPKTRRTQKKVQKTKAPLKLSDGMMLSVASKVHSKLIYKNLRTEEKTVWTEKNESKDLTVADIRAMKSQQIRFFSDGLISIEEILDSGYEEYTKKEIYDALLLQRYYKISNVDIEDMILNDVDELVALLKTQKGSFKTNVIVTARELIQEGRLDSLGAIRTLEKALDCELMGD